MVAATGQVTTSALLALPLALFVDRPWLLPMPGAAAWTAVASAALFCTALGYALYFRILAAAGATNLLLVTLLMPVGARCCWAWRSSASRSTRASSSAWR